MRPFYHQSAAITTLTSQDSEKVLLEAYSTRWAAMRELLGVTGLTVNGRDKDEGRRARPRETPVEPAIAAVNAITPTCTTPHYQSGVPACGTAMSDRNETWPESPSPSKTPWHAAEKEDCLALPIHFVAGLVKSESENFE